MVWQTSGGEPVEVVRYAPADFFKRTPFDPSLIELLQRERLLVVGVGSVGAPMALEMARTGIGGLILLDKDRLEIHNCMRHTLGPAYVGWPKAGAMAHYIAEHVPGCRTVAVDEDLFSGDRSGLRALMAETEPTRILAVTDSLRVQYLCQRLALCYGLPLMAVWCDNNAVEGEIFLWEPGEAQGWRPGRPRRGCYGCLRPPEEVTITRSRHFDYSSDDPDTYGGEPALGTFINRINAVASIFLTAWMLRDAPKRPRLVETLLPYYEGKGLQYIRLGGPYAYGQEAAGQMTAKAPWGVEWYRVLQKEECSLCGNPEGNAAVLFPEDRSDGDEVESWEAFEEIPPETTEGRDVE
ncbi:MAG: hypothetical protein D6795_16005 [Deltaproteobacteria bacterium]|nr:MAG: hypothetical protein D6795_16005 [Deltaproteobacteria bacterium]